MPSKKTPKELQPHVSIASPRVGFAPGQEGYLSELAQAATDAADYARGASQVLDAVADGEEAFPDPEATAKAVMALAGQVNSLAAVVFELVRLIRDDDIPSRSKGLPH